LITIVSWRAIFLVNLPIGIAGLWLTLRYASETPRSPKREIDASGQITAILSLGCLAGALIEAGAQGWSNVWVVAGLVSAVAFAGLFVLQELRAAQPMLPLSLFRHRMFALTSLVGLLVNVAFYGLIFVFSLYFQTVNGWSPLATGLAFVPMMAMVLPANLIAPHLAERIGTRTTIAAGAALAALGCLSLAGIEGGTSYAAICVQLVAVGAGLGLLVPPLTSALLGSVEKSRSGLAAGVLNSTRQTGSVLGVALFGSLVEQSGAFVAGARASLIISTIVLVAAGAMILFGASKAGDRTACDRMASGGRK
jgi:DHA2 family methylenomycin A resistance protein-like MFS transporter